MTTPVTPSAAHFANPPVYDEDDSDLYEPSCRCHIAPPCNYCMNAWEEGA